MTDKAAIAGDYADFKLIRTRKVCQVIIELPIEDAHKVFASIGMPNPAGNTPCAVALIKPIAPMVGDDTGGGSVPVLAAPPVSKQRQRWVDLRPSARAAMLCNDAEFWHYLGTCGVTPPTTSVAADISLKSLCNIQSKTELDEHANETFERLASNFKAWRLARAHGQLER